MPCIAISCTLADSLFPTDASGDLLPFSPDVGLTLALGWGLPLGEMDIEALPVDAGVEAANGEVLVAVIWVAGQRFEVTCD